MNLKELNEKMLSGEIKVKLTKPKDLNPKTKQIPLNTIKITKHAEQRIKERVIINFNNQKDKIRFVYKARYEGISMAHCSLYDLGCNKELYDYLKKYYKGHRGSETIRLYKGYVFIFVGAKGRILKTVIRIDQKFQDIF